MPPPVRPQSELLPFHDPAFSWTTFESFFCDFLASEPTLIVNAGQKELSRKITSARPYGCRGESQHGIDILADVEGGETWVFQCKHYRHWGPENTRHAIDTCTFSAARKFLLVTRELSEECFTVVSQHPDWELWDSRRISREFRLHAHRDAGARILFTHFGPGWDQAFFGLHGDGPLLTADAKFAPLRQPNRRFHHRLPLVGREAWLTQLDSFVRNAEARVFMFVGRGGLGKSRILVSWSETFGANHPDALLRFVSDVSADFSAALSAISDPAVLAFDDAHRLIEVRRPLFPELARRPNWKLVLSLRPGAQNVVRQELVESGFDTRHIIEGPELRRLNDEETMNLVREALGPELVTQYDQFLYGVSRDCPLVAVLGAELLREGRVPAEVLIDESAFRAHVFDSLLSDAQQIEEDFGVHKVRDFLGLLALLAPVKVDTDFKYRAAAFLGNSWPAHRIAQLIDALDDAGLLLSGGAGVRIMPDLLSDQVAFRACFNQHQQSTGFVERVLDHFRPDQFPRMLEHLAESEWRTGSERFGDESVVEPVWHWFIEQFDKSPFFKRSQLIEKWTSIAALQPARSLMLARRALDMTTAPEPDPPFVKALHSYAYVQEDVAKMLRAVAEIHATHVPPCLDLLWTLGHARERPSAHESSHPLQLIAEVAKFRPWKNVDVPLAALDWIERLCAGDEWLACPSGPAWLIQKMFEPFFVSSMEQTWRAEMNLHFQLLPLHLENTTPVRERARSLLVKLLERKDVRIALGVVRVLKHALEKERLLGNSEAPADWRSIWLDERLKTFDVLRAAARIYASSSVVLFHIRKELLRNLHRRDEKELRTASRALFREIKDTLDLRLCRALLGSANEEFDRPLPPLDRTVEWQAAIDRRWHQFLRDIAALALQLFPQPAELLSRLERERSTLAAFGEHPKFGRLLQAIAEVQPDSALAIADVLLCAPEHALGFHFDSLILHPTRRKLDYRLELCRRALNTTPSFVAVGAIAALSAWRRLNEFPEEAWSAVEATAGKSESLIAREIVSFVCQNARDATLRDWRLLASLEIATDDAALMLTFAMALAQLLVHGKEMPDAALALRVLTKFEACQDLNDNQVEYAMKVFGKRYPGVVFELLSRRVRARAIDGAKIRPFPLHAEELNLKGLLDSAEGRRGFDQLCDALFGDKPLETEELRLLQVAIFASTENPQQQLDELLDRAATAEHLQRVVDLFASSFLKHLVLSHPDFVRRALQLARKFDSETHERVFTEFRRHQIMGPRGTEGGNPDISWQAILETAEQLEKQYNSDQELGPLYRTILEDERKMLAQMQREFQRTDDE